MALLESQLGSFTSSCFMFLRAKNYVNRPMFQSYSKIKAAQFFETLCTSKGKADERGGTGEVKGRKIRGKKERKWEENETLQ